MGVKQKAIAAVADELLKISPLIKGLVENVKGLSAEVRILDQRLTYLEGYARIPPSAPGMRRLGDDSKESGPEA